MHCLPFHLHLLDHLLCSKMIHNYCNFFWMSEFLEIFALVDFCAQLSYDPINSLHQGDIFFLFFLTHGDYFYKQQFRLPTLCVSWWARIINCTILGRAPCSLRGAWLAGHRARLRMRPTTALISGQRLGGWRSLTRTGSP